MVVYAADYKAERDVLVKEAVPKLKEFCARLQLDFDVVDLRWGVSDSAVNDHSVQAVCAAQVAACQRQSSGPNFVVSQHAGARVCFYYRDSASWLYILKTLCSFVTKSLLLLFVMKVIYVFSHAMTFSQ